jgi:3'(2'), 5'-bisphosphate nucleotidase
LISETFPNDPLIGEEDSAALQTPEERETLSRVTQFVRRFTDGATPKTVSRWIDRGAGRTANRFWTLDPVDGTKGFLRGDQYAIALALIVDGQLQVGVLGCPNLSDGYRPDVGGPGSILVASRGDGAWVTPLEDDPDFQRLRVSEQSDPAQARLLRSFESGHTNVSQIDFLAEEMGIEADPVRMDSQAKYAVLAAGQAEIYLRLLSSDRPNYREKIWDQAAGALITLEAGGRVNDLDGKPLDFTAGRTLAHNRGVCATNGHLHAATLEALQAIEA